MRGDRALEALLEQLEVALEPGRGAHGRERVHAALVAVWRATIPPPSSLQRTSAKPARAHRGAEIRRGPGSAARSPAGSV